MPQICFSYPADLPMGAGNRDIASSSPPGPRQMPLPCLSYPFMCFGYPSDVPLDPRNRDAAQPPLAGLRRMPAICFSY